MKIAVTAQGYEMTSEVDPRFGRARHFVIYDTESEEFSARDNSANLNAMQGAGVQAAENISREGVAALITGHCGPKAFKVLQAAGIKVYTGASGTVAETIERFSNGELTEAEGPDVEGHWM
ncbi:MAG: NifB/NifX family molybdenum-iron cluster-binding protein [bacterium]|nr:MAG: NifB/NifX family molybdenum-iron cluster-binding protein [bacterium]